MNGLAVLALAGLGAALLIWREAERELARERRRRKRTARHLRNAQADLDAANMADARRRHPVGKGRA